MTIQFNGTAQPDIDKPARRRFERYVERQQMAMRPMATLPATSKIAVTGDDRAAYVKQADGAVRRVIITPDGPRLMKKWDKARKKAERRARKRLTNG